MAKPRASRQRLTRSIASRVPNTMPVTIAVPVIFSVMYMPCTRPSKTAGARKPKCRFNMDAFSGYEPMKPWSRVCRSIQPMASITRALITK